MQIEFLEDCIVEMHVDICCFSGIHRTEEKVFLKGERLDCLRAERGEKKKGGRDRHVLIDNGTIHPDWFDVPERCVHVCEETNG